MNTVDQSESVNSALRNSRTPPYLRIKGSTSNSDAKLAESLEGLPGKLAQVFQPVAGCELSFSIREKRRSHVGAVLDELNGRVIACEFVVNEWECAIQVLFDRLGLYSLLEVALGGFRRDGEVQAERPFTALEVAISQQFSELFAAAMQEAFSEVANITLTFQRVEKRMDLLTRDDRSGPGLLVELGLELGEPSGSIFMLLSPVALSRLQTACSVRGGSEGKIDDAFSSAFIPEIQSTPVTLKAVIRESEFTLADVARMKKGDVLRLGRSAGDRLTLVAEGRPLVRCALGRADERYTVRVERVDSLTTGVVS
ncbi:MAG: FliM/FliN family flagellar motor switch protein [Beijerinckiaceae bacterium]